MVQYNAALVISGAIKGTLRDRIYRELGLESLAERRWSRKIVFFHRIINGHLPVYLQSYISYCGEEFRKIKSTVQFKTKILSFIRPKENSIFKIHDITGTKLLNRLSLHFSNLNEHKFRHNFRAAIDPMCSCGLEPEATLHYLLSCNLYPDLRIELLNDICVLNPKNYLMKSF